MNQNDKFLDGLERKYKSPVQIFQGHFINALHSLTCNCRLSSHRCAKCNEYLIRNWGGWSGLLCCRYCDELFTLEGGKLELVDSYSAFCERQV